MLKSRRSWTSDQKRTLVDLARRRRAEGVDFQQVAAELGVGKGSLYQWMRQFPERALQPITIVDMVPSGTAISLVTPDGYRFEGLDLGAAVRLREQLR
jgi:hypothetical protein